MYYQVALRNKNPDSSSYLRAISPEAWASSSMSKCVGKLRSTALLKAQTLARIQMPSLQRVGVKGVEYKVIGSAESLLVNVFFLRMYPLPP